MRSYSDEDIEQEREAATIPDGEETDEGLAESDEVDWGEAVTEPR